MTRDEFTKLLMEKLRSMREVAPNCTWCSHRRANVQVDKICTEVRINNDIIETGYTPVATITCSNCGQMRIFSLYSLGLTSEYNEMQKEEDRLGAVENSE